MKPSPLRIISCTAMILCLIAAPLTQAADWTFFGSARSGHLYYDKSSIQKNMEIAQVRTMAIFSDDGKKEFYHALRKTGKALPTADLLSYSITGEEFDCANNKQRVSSMTIYNERGGTIHSSRIINDEWGNVLPGTNGDILARIVCLGSKR